MFRHFMKVSEKKQKNETQIASSSILLEPLEPRILLSAEAGVPPQDLAQDILLAATEASIYEAEPVFDADQTASETELNTDIVYATVDNVIGAESTVADNQTDTSISDQVTSDQTDAGQTEVDADTIVSETADTDADVDQEVIFTAQDLYQFTQQAGMQIVFIDPSVPDYESLLAQLPQKDTSSDSTVENATGTSSFVYASNVTDASTITYTDLSDEPAEKLQTLATLQQTDDGNSIQFYVLDAKQDGISQITDVLAQYENIAAVHILSHGAAGYLRLGNNTVNNNNLNNYQSQLRQWGSSLTETADVLLYGCDLADGQAGVDFITRISELTGADVAASDDATGSTTEGGDWLLEQTTGVIETASLINSAEDYHYLLADVVSTTASETFIDTDTDDVYFFEDNWGIDTLNQDTNSAGVDTLNFSAVTTDLIFTLHADGSINVTDGVNTLTASSIENIIGGSGSNDFVFEQGASLAGDLNGGTGTATLNYSVWTDVVNANLLAGTASGITGSISNINNITGGRADDILTGDDNDNIIIGNAGNDRIYGEEGRDKIYGGEGNDTLEGGAGNDTYFFENSFGTDTVNDSGDEGLDRAADSTGDSWDFSAVTTDMQFYFGSRGYLSGEITQAVSLDNSVKESYRNMFAVETIIGSSSADQFHIYQTADYGTDPGTNVLLLDGSDGSDTYTSYFVPTGITAPMDVAIRDQGNFWDTDKAIALGSDGADLLEVNQTSVDACQSFTINAEADLVTMTPPLVTAGTDKQSFGYNVYGDQSGLESLEVIARQGDDTVFIASTPSNMSVAINGNEGDDTFIVGRSVAGITASVDLIQGNDTTGDLIISGDEDRDILFVDDSSDTNNNIANLSDSYISGLDMQVGIEYSQIETLGLVLGQGNDTLTVTSTIGGASYITGNNGEDTLDIQSATGVVQVRGGNDNDVITLHSNNTTSQVSLYGEDGNDLLNIRRIDERVTVRGGNDNDTINIGSGAPVVGGIVDYITDLLDVDGEAGTDILNVDDSGDTDDNELLMTNDRIRGLDMAEGILYANMEFINIATGSGNENINVQSTALNSLTTITTNDGDATVNVSSDAPANKGNLDGIEGELSLILGDGVNELNISDITSMIADDAIVITDTRISGLAPAAINYSTSGRFAQGVNIWMGEGSDTADIEGTHSDSVTTVWANDGDDDITVIDNSAADDGLLVLHGEKGSDIIDASAWNSRLIISGDAAVVTYTSTDRRIENLSQIYTTDANSGGQDTLTGGSADDVIFGGRDNDDIDGQEGNNVVLGDHGVVNFDNGQQVTIATTDMENGGADTITTGSGDDVIIAGAGDDVVNAGNGNNIVFADNGTANYRLNGMPEDLFETFDQYLPVYPSGHPDYPAEALGGNDTVVTGDGNDQVYGGGGNDRISTGSGDDILHGDGGKTTYNYGAINRMTTEATSFFIGGDDFLDGGAGQDIMTGGFGHDTFVGNLGEDTMFGEYGRVTIDDEKGKFVVRLGQGTLDLIASAMFGLYNPDVLAFGPGAFLGYVPIGAATAFQPVYNVSSGTSGHHNGNNINPEPEPVKTAEELAFESVLTQNPPAAGEEVKGLRDLLTPEPEPEIKCITIAGAKLGLGELWNQLIGTESLNDAVEVVGDMIDVLITGKPKELPESVNCKPGAEPNSDDDYSALDVPVLVAGSILGVNAFTSAKQTKQKSVKLDPGEFDRLERESKERRYSRW